MEKYLEKYLATSVEKKVESRNWIWPGAGMDLGTHNCFLNFHSNPLEFLRKSAFGKMSDRQQRSVWAREVVSALVPSADFTLFKWQTPSALGGSVSRNTPRLDCDTGEPSLVDAGRREGTLKAKSRNRAEEQGMETENSRAAVSQLQREGCCPMGPDPDSS